MSEARFGGRGEHSLYRREADMRIKGPPEGGMSSS